jgi:protein-tyrosine phosphatase
MRQIESLPLFVGNASDVRNVRQLFDAQIAAVVDLAAAEPTISLPRELIYCRFPLVDGGTNAPELLRAAILTVSELLRSRMNTLVCCGAGLSRSPSIAAAALALSESIAPQAALVQVAASGPHDVHPLLWSHVCEIVAELHGRSAS